MKSLQSLISSLQEAKVSGIIPEGLSGISIDSRTVKPGDCFVALSGTRTDGSLFIRQAIASGAAVIVCQIKPEDLPADVCCVTVPDPAEAAGIIASEFYDRPSAKMIVTGVTGTNGKTSVATLLFQVFSRMGHCCGLISTVHNQIAETVYPSSHTTPDAVSLQKLLAQMQQQGCSHVFMEVSSHAVHQKRIAGTKFTAAIFTNITHDHLDYHLSFENYLKAKKCFFDGLDKNAFALLNADDRHSVVMTEHCKAKVSRFALRNAAEFKARIIENTVAGLSLDINGMEMHTGMLGEFNAYNLTAVFGAAVLLGVEPREALMHISAIHPPEGRMERVKHAFTGLTVLVDYAHTPDALKNVLQTIRHFRTGNEQLITVVGCGGNRDQSKRPLMASIATHFSDKVILTSDNPRDEDPEAILQEMKAGVPADERRKLLQIVDRKEALRTACMMASKGDIILVAGKGHEKYQEIKGVKHPFHDTSVVQEIINELINV